MVKFISLLAAGSLGSIAASAVVHQNCVNPGQVALTYDQGISYINDKNASFNLYLKKAVY